MTKGITVINLLNALAESGQKYCYLRNYENLPDKIGNDIDILVEGGNKNICKEILVKSALEHGWLFLKATEFGPLALYLANPETGEVLHFDIFDRIEWHALEYADPKTILSNCRFSDYVYIPQAEHEIYLNLMSHLIYHGKIRDKHKSNALDYVDSDGEKKLVEAFNCNLGFLGEPLLNNLKSNGWNSSFKLLTYARLAAFINHGIAKPHRLISGLIRYIIRVIKKSVSPPGCFIAFEGADGVGKSTLIKEIRPWISEWNAGREPYQFHWKPSKRIGDVSNPRSINPRSHDPRGSFLSFIYLIYHLLGFLSGWIFNIYPALIRSKAVIADRYVYDFYLDQKRFRLSLPSYVCRFVINLVPQPDIVIGMIADADVIVARKPELNTSDIEEYQERWNILGRNSGKYVTVDACGLPGAVLHSTKTAILDYLTKRN